LCKFSIVDVSISKTFDKIQKSIANIFTRSENRVIIENGKLSSEFFTWPLNSLHSPAAAPDQRFKTRLGDEHSQTFSEDSQKNTVIQV
jgi:hypothetical protein